MEISHPEIQCCCGIYNNPQSNTIVVTILGFFESFQKKPSCLMETAVLSILKRFCLVTDYLNNYCPVANIYCNIYLFMGNKLRGVVLSWLRSLLKDQIQMVQLGKLFQPHRFYSVKSHKGQSSPNAVSYLYEANWRGHPEMWSAKSSVC